MLHDTDVCLRALSEYQVKVNAVNLAVGSACLNTYGRVAGLLSGDLEVALCELTYYQQFYNISASLKE